MPLQIVCGDITRMPVDAIVNAANETLLGGGGVDGAIHRAAGPGLLEECRRLNGCQTGQAKLTGGYRLPCRYVIHTVGPVWQGGGRGEREALASAYRESLRLAAEQGCETVAFPLISSGAYGYPRDEALSVATETIAGFLRENELTVFLVIFDKSAYRIRPDLMASLEAAITRARADGLSARESACFAPSKRRRIRPASGAMGLGRRAGEDFAAACDAAAPAAEPSDLDAALRQLDESFSQMLLRKIDERGMKDSECYKKANIDRKLFSKIRSDVHYRPSKPTVLAFAIALELPLEETREMLMKAGFALSRSSKFDVIVEYFIRSGNYNVFEINEALFAFDQSLLGA